MKKYQFNAITVNRQKIICVVQPALLKSIIFIIFCKTIIRLKEIRQNNEVRANEFSQSFSSIPKNSFVENIQLLKMTGKGQTAKNTHLLNRLNTEKGTLQNYLRIIQERKKIVQDQVKKIKEYNSQLQNDIITLKKEKKEREEQNSELKKQKLMNIRKYTF